MAVLHKLAAQLNDAISSQHPSSFKQLSERGKHIYFPKEGILGQSGQAAGKKWNATIGIGLEDDGTPMRLASMHALVDKTAPKDIYPYVNSYGKPELRAAWAEMIKKKNPSLKAPFSQPVVCAGLTHSLSMAAFLLLDAGDTLILPDLTWDNYDLMFQNVYGAQFREFRTFSEGRLDVASMREAIKQTSGKKVLLLNFPNNPTGYTPRIEEVTAIIAALKEEAELGNAVSVILDDAYFGLVYEPGVAQESLFAQLADLHENISVWKVDGATKEDYVWGHRVGFLCVAGKGMSDTVLKAYEAKIAGAVRATVSNCSHLGQSLLLKTYQSLTYAEEKAAKYAIMKKRYETVKAVLQDPKFAEVFTALPYNSGYFMCVELKPHLQAEAIRMKLLEQFETGVIALGNRFRIAYSSVPAGEIPALFENIYNACA